MVRTNTIVIILLFAGVAAEVMGVRPHHPHFVWQKIPGFYALLGLVSAIVLMTFAKWLGKHWLYRPEGEKK